MLQNLPTRGLVVLICFFLAVTSTGRNADASEIADHPELEELFSRHGVEGAFVLLDVDNDRYHAVYRERIDKRRYPASTFKIANSLIALETGVVEDENKVIPYGGKPQPIKAWEQDMSMRDAIKISNVPVYQELARRVGFESYRLWLEKLGYGNLTPGNNIKRFWLDGPLAISPTEQVDFVTRLAEGRLAVSPRNQATVRDMLLMESGDQGKLFGKSGWSLAAKPQIGWWVGWVERDDGLYVFALTIDITSPEDADQRVELGKALLKALEIYH
ncbi:MAG: class D beta-lactamase [Hyphomicrobiales bacterium]|nr:class D beta-lactamase [Hyphomicrobiales bacterium]